MVLRPVASASSRFSRGLGYGLCVYQSRRAERDFSLKQYEVSSPSQMVRGSGNFFLHARSTRYYCTLLAQARVQVTVCYKL